MIWNVEYTSEAKKDIDGIYICISRILRSPENAKGQVERIVGKIKTLQYMPLRFRLYKTFLFEEDVRVLMVDIYKVFYYIDIEKKQVQILRIMYSRRLSEPDCTDLYIPRSGTFCT